MCHSSVLTWAASAFTSDMVAGKSVVEVGSYDVNGTVRPIVEALGPASYLGVDQSAGPGVDLVADVATVPVLYPDGFGLVISTEMLEHVDDWKAAVDALVQLVAKSGTVALTTRSPGFPYHPYPVDNWRYPVDMMRDILQAYGLKIVHCVTDPEAPGVFAVATKPARWHSRSIEVLDLFEVPGV